MFFTIANHNEAKNPKGFETKEITFYDIPNLIRCNKAYMACSVKDNYRKSSNYNGREDVLILDIDDNCSIEQAKTIFSEYEYFIVTTRSHQKDKGGVICDRFRIFLRLDKTINNAADRELFIRDIFDLYFFVDKSTKDNCRFYFASPIDAEVIYNDGKDLHVNSLSVPITSTKPITQEPKPIEHTESIFAWCELTERFINEHGEVLESNVGIDDRDSKLNGVKKFLDNNFYQGNKSNCLFNAACMMVNDSIFSDDEIVDILMSEWEHRKSNGDKFSDALQNIKGSFKLQ